MQIRIARIERIVPESRSVKTFFFRGTGNPRPGNYLMVWIPGSGQIPLSISSFRDGICGLTVKRVGATTEAMHRLNPGDLIGITPPLGSSFSMKGNRILLVSGGIGIAPLLYLALEARALGKRSVVVAGGYDVAKVPRIRYGSLRRLTGRLMVNPVLAMADRIIAVSRFNYNEVLANTHTRPAKIHLIYHGFQPTPRAALPGERSAPGLLPPGGRFQPVRPDDLHRLLVASIVSENVAAVEVAAHTPCAVRPA